ncbi:hypothetical protein [Pseudomonas sp. DC3000-4b1]|uniref:hypothetical protein n=1 Tax=unclassified Pseudomonas TaxID=196821 RepID=UPI003CF3B445
MDQVDLGLSLLRPARLSPADFKALIRQRGWRMADAAVRWDVRPETLSRVAADPQRELRWDDLVRALPLLTRRERAAATAARLQLHPPRPRAAPVAVPVAEADPAQPSSSAPRPFAWDDEDDEFESFAPPGDGFRYRDYVGVNSELVVVSEIGTFAAEGTVLVVTDTRVGVDEDGAVQEEYLCEAPQGATLWLTPTQMDDWVVSTGKTRSGF